MEGIERGLPRWICEIPKGSSPPTWVKLTPIDIQMPKFFYPVILAYQSAPPQFLSRLEASLKQLLCLYRELAGRIRTDEYGNVYIHLCNEGVFWLEATANDRLDEFIDKRDHGFLHQLVPMSSCKVELDIPLLVQVTRFSCGGIVVGFGVNHLVVDMNAFPQFLMDLSKQVHEPEETISTFSTFDRSCMMPRDPPCTEFDHPEYSSSRGFFRSLTPEQVQLVKTCKLHFSRDKLSKLKSECSNTFSTFVCLAAYIWRVVTLARRMDGDTNTILVCPANARRTLSLPAGYFGNVVFRRVHGMNASDLVKMSLQETASIVDSMLKRNSDATYLRSVVDLLAEQQRSRGEETSNSLGHVCASPNLVITSWARSTIYDVEFGFGKPVYAGSSDGPCEGYVRVVPAPDGGLYVLPTLFTEHVKNLESLLN